MPHQEPVVNHGKAQISTEEDYTASYYFPVNEVEYSNNAKAKNERVLQSGSLAIFTLF